MEISVNKIDSANVTISGNITKAEIDSALEKIAKDLSKQTNIPGFRKGKTPIPAVKKYYGNKLVEDAKGENLRKLLEDGQKEAGIESNQIITEPHFSEFNEAENGDISVEIEVSLRPAFELGDYMAHVSVVERPEVTSDEVQNRITEMSEQVSNFTEVDKAVENGDTLVFDFEGFVDGKPFEGGKAEGYSLKIGGGNFIAGFEEQLVGLKKDEEKDVVVTFPENYQAENLAGKEATFKCKVLRVEQKEAFELNEDNASKLNTSGKEPNEGETQVEALQRTVKEEIGNEKLSKIYNEETKPALRETLSNSYSFDLPKSVVEQEIEQRANNILRDYSKEDLEALKDNKDKIIEIRNQVSPEAEKSVRATFVIDALGTAEGISVSDQELQQIIGYEAMMGGQDPVETMKKYEESGYLPLIKMSILEDKVLTKLLEKKMAK